MSSRIGLISDTHSTVAPLREALQLFEKNHVDTIICAGDIAGYGDDELSATIELLKQYDCKMVSGNHDDPTELQNQPADVIHFLTSLPRSLQLETEGCSIYVVHAEPPDHQHDGIKLLDPEGRPFPDRLQHWQEKLEDFDHDILVVGHTHQVFAEQIGKTLVINPGSTKYNHTCMILELPSRKIEVHALSNKQPVLTWNWGKFFVEQINDN